MRTPRLEKKLPSFLDEAEVVRLLEADTGDTFTDRRDRALLETIYGGGLRVSEATGLDLVDLQLDQGFAVVRGKGGKERLAPLGSGAARSIEEYLPERAVAGRKADERGGRALHQQERDAARRPQRAAAAGRAGGPGGPGEGP